MPYANWTYKARNPIQRLSHKRRFEKTARLIARILPEGGSLLDFGCADGFLLSKLKGRLPSSVVLNGYEPFPDSKVDDSLVIFNDEAQLEGRDYDVVSCFEVLEHFSQEKCRKTDSDHEETPVSRRAARHLGSRRGWSRRSVQGLDPQDVRP